MPYLQYVNHADFIKEAPQNPYPSLSSPKKEKSPNINNIPSLLLPPTFPPFCLLLLHLPLHSLHLLPVMLHQFLITNSEQCLFLAHLPQRFLNVYQFTIASWRVRGLAVSCMKRCRHSARLLRLKGRYRAYASSAGILIYCFGLERLLFYSLCIRTQLIKIAPTDTHSPIPSHTIRFYMNRRSEGEVLGEDALDEVDTQSHCRRDQAIP